MHRPVILISVLLVATLTAGAWAVGKAVSIQVRQGQVRSGPTYLSKVVGTLGYGERLTNLGGKGDWLKIRSKKGLKGWVHVSAVTEKRIVLTSGKSKAALKSSKEELILAGKGFSREVEKRYRASNPKAAFDRVDKAEKENNPGPARIASFLKKGRLKPLNLEIKARKAAPSVRSGGGEDENVGP